VKLKRTVLSRVFESTVLAVTTTVWSTSDSSREAFADDVSGVAPAKGGRYGTIWFSCGDDSRSHRTVQVLLRESW
jgi:hypothetical protein